MKEQFNTMLKNFGAGLGLDGLEADEHGACALMFDDVVVNLELREETGTLFLYSALGAAPEEGREKLYSKLLAANVFFKDTQGATLGVDENAAVVMLQYQVPFLSLDDGGFSRTLENFVNVAEAWGKRISEAGVHGKTDSASAAPSAQTGMPPMGMRV